jgi:hypothetical protein
MTDMRGEFTPELESDSGGSMIFKTVAALIVALMLGALAVYYFEFAASNAPVTRVALVSPPTIPIKPVIAPRMDTPTPQPVSAPSPTLPKSTDNAAPTNNRSASLRPHKRVTQSADLQPAADAPAAPATADSPALTAPTTLPAPEPAQPAEPAQQPATQP